MAERFVVECYPPDDHQPAWLKEFEQFEAAFKVAVILAEPDRMVLLQLPYSVDGQLMTGYPCALPTQQLIRRKS